MPSRLRSAVASSRQRLAKRTTTNPGVVIDRQQGGWDFGAPHRNLAAWQVQIIDAFGTNSISTAMVFLAQLSKLTEQKWSEASLRLEPDERELNAALNLVTSMRPSTEMEAALAAQMVAVHWMTMKVAAQAVSGDVVDPRLASVAGKLARTFAMQMETMARTKGKAGVQRISVKSQRHEHKHVHVHATPGGQHFGDQPHAPRPTTKVHIIGSPIAIEQAGEPACGTAVRGENQKRGELPKPSSKG